MVGVKHQREGLSIISTVPNQRKVRWEVFLIRDNLKVRHARKSKYRLADHEEQIEVSCLLGYIPELNPDERKNAVLKKGVTRLMPARGKAQLKKTAIRHLRILQKSPQHVRKYFLYKPVRYAA